MCDHILVQVLWLSGNPVALHSDYRTAVIGLLPQLDSLDNSGTHWNVIMMLGHEVLPNFPIAVTDEERREAENKTAHQHKVSRICSV